MALAYVNTETSITVIALGVLFAVLYRMRIIRVCWHELLDGMVIAVIICKFCNEIFYKINPEYMLHGGFTSVSISLDALKKNLVDLGRLLFAFSVINIVGVPIVLIAIAVCIFAAPIIIKEYYCGVIVLGIMLAVGKTFYFETTVLEKEDLYSSLIIGIIDTDSIYVTADTISEYASDNNCLIVVFLTGHRALGYATGAINYNQYISYNAFYDRRSATYLELKENMIEENV